MTNPVANYSSQRQNGTRTEPRPRCSLGKALFALAGVVAAFAGRGFFQTTGHTPVRIGACGRFSCPEFNSSELRPYEQKVGRELLQLKGDGNPVALWLTASHDPQGASSPERYNISKLQEDQQQVKFVQIKDYREICREIDAATEAGPVKLIVLNFHGNQTHGEISENSSFTLKDPHEECFKKTEKDAKIVLMSCSTGEGRHSLAEVMARQSRRTVIAPSTQVKPQPIKIDRESGIRLFADESQDEDVTRVFDPTEGPLSVEELNDIEEEHRSQSLYEQEIQNLVVTGRWNQLEKSLEERQISTSGLKEALQFAVNIRSERLLTLLLKQKNMTRIARSEAAVIAAQKGDAAMLKILLSKGAPISQYGRGVVIMVAATNGHHDCVRAVFQDKGPIPQDLLSIGFSSAIHYGHTQTVKLIFDEWNPGVKTGIDAYKMALELGHHAIAKFIAAKFSFTDESALEKQTT